MTMDQLAAHDAAERLRVLDAAIATAYRGIRVRTEEHAVSVEALQRNLERLKAERAALQIRMGRVS